MYTVRITITTCNKTLRHNSYAEDGKYTCALRKLTSECILCNLSVPCMQIFKISLIILGGLYVFREKKIFTICKQH